MMQRKYVQLTAFEWRNMANDGNIDYKYWHDKSLSERLLASSIMTSVAFREPDFFKKKVDRSIFSARKHSI